MKRFGPRARPAPLRQERLLFWVFHRLRLELGDVADPRLALPIRDLGYLVIHTSVKTISVELHELSFDDLKAPPSAGEIRPGGTLSAFETARGLHILNRGELQ